MEVPRATPDAAFKRVAEEDSRRQMRMGIKKGFPSLAQLAATQLRCIAAGELAGARGDLGGTGPLLANLANVALVAFARNQESAAEFRGAR